MALEDRMTRIARDEVQRALAGTELEEVKESEGGLGEQVRDLHDHLHRALTLIDALTKRVDELEKSATEQTDDTSASRAATPRRTKTTRGSA